MKILVLRTDSESAYLGLFNDHNKIDEITWPALRTLSQTLLANISKMAEKVGGLESLEGLVVFKGPGSFTGLRIGISVVNTLAYSLKIPIVGSAGEGWLEDGISNLLDSQDHKLIVPEYGAKPNITKPIK